MLVHVSTGTKKNTRKIGSYYRHHMQADLFAVISPHIPRKKIRHSWKMSSTQKCHVLPTGYTLKKYNCNLKSRAVFIELHENFNSQGERSIQSQVQINRNMHLNLQRTQVVFLMSFTLVVSHLVIKYKINCQCITQPTMNDKSSFKIIIYKQSAKCLYSNVQL